MWSFWQRKPGAGRTGRACVLLSRSTASVESLTRILDGIGVRARAAASLYAARALVEEMNAGVLLSETAFLDGTWEDALRMACEYPIPFILLLPEFDGRVWVAALNRGAYDVIAQPYDGERLGRTVIRAFRSGPAGVTIAARPGAGAR